jgi:hypothetical protein
MSQQQGRALKREISAELERLGIEAEFGVTNGSHQFVQFHIDGRRRRYFFPLTPGNHWAGKQAIAGVRRLVRGVPA